MSFALRVKPVLCIGSFVLITAACGTTGGIGGSRSESSGGAAPAPAPAPAASKTPAGMNDRGEVVDPRQVPAGSGQKVKGIDDWEGEIVGKPVAGSKFEQLKIGMSMNQVTGLVGQPTDAGAYITGKSFIPFYFGSDRNRFEMTYKGKGRLIFAGGSIGNWMGGNLIWIINSAAETGVR